MYNWEIPGLLFYIIALPKSLCYELGCWVSKTTSLSQSCTLHTLRHSLPSWIQPNALHLFPKSIQRRNERANKINPNVTQELNTHSFYYLVFSFFAIHKKPDREAEVSSLLMMSEGWSLPRWSCRNCHVCGTWSQHPCLLSCHTSCSALSYDNLSLLSPR